MHSLSAPDYFDYLHITADCVVYIKRILKMEAKKCILVGQHSDVL